MRRLFELLDLRRPARFALTAPGAAVLAATFAASFASAQADPAKPAAKPAAAKPAAETAGPTLAGFWNVYDDDESKPDAVFFFYEKDGVWEGRLVKEIHAPEDPPEDPLCRHCPGEKKDKPMLGLVIVWGMKPHGATKFESGHILDPRNGTVWNAQLDVTPDNQKLLVRGYVMTPMLGQTRTWRRAPDDTMALADVPGDPFPGQPVKKAGAHNGGAGGVTGGGAAHSGAAGAAAH